MWHCRHCHEQGPYNIFGSSQRGGATRLPLDAGCSGSDVAMAAVINGTSPYALPPLWVAVRDERLRGIGGVSINATIEAYTGSCSGGFTPSFTAESSNTTSGLGGVARLQLLLNFPGCSDGVATLRLQLNGEETAVAPDLTPSPGTYVLIDVALYLPSTADASQFSSVSTQSSGPAENQVVRPWPISNPSRL